jgi:integrase
MPLKVYPPRPGKTPNRSIRGTYLGVKVDRSAGTPSRKIAAQQKRKLEGRIERGEYPERAPEPAGETFIGAAVAYMKAGGERVNMPRLIEYFAETPISEIDQGAIDNAAIELYPTETPATRNRKVYTPVSAVLRKAGRDLKLKRPEGADGRVVTAWLSREDAAAIINACDEPAFALLLQFLLYSGCRISEAMRLKWEDFVPEQRIVYVGTSKNGDPRTVLLRKELLEGMVILRGEKTEGQIFPFRMGGGLKDRLTRAKLKACGVKMPDRKVTRRIPPHRLKFVGFHTFCHTWATWMRRYGRADLQGLVATNRWRDPRSAARYAHVVAHEEWERVETLPSIGFGGKSVD